MHGVQLWGRRAGEALLALGLSVMVVMVFGNVPKVATWPWTH
jgi:hypothetical protein